MQNKINFLVNILNDKYKQGKTLKQIYDEVLENLGDNWKVIFLSFLQVNKKDKKFMKEFNSTSFI